LMSLQREVFLLLIAFWQKFLAFQWDTVSVTPAVRAQCVSQNNISQPLSEYIRHSSRVTSINTPLIRYMDFQQTNLRGSKI
jgi:hypothetical protein